MPVSLTLEYNPVQLQAARHSGQGDLQPTLEQASRHEDEVAFAWTTWQDTAGVERRIW